MGISLPSSATPRELIPVDRHELAAAIRDGDAAIYPVGGGLGLDYGGPPARPGLTVRTTNLNRVVDFQPRDMTLTVEAGATFAQIDALAKAENLRLPVDVPFPDRATLGGAMAVNAAGPRRYGCGTLRDYVLGCTVVNAAGELVKSGGRVVKNVAGYDLHKLHCGAVGTLGVIVEVTLKLMPRPEAAAFVAVPMTADSLERVTASQTRPAVVDVVNGRPLPGVPSGPCLLLGYEGPAEAVRWQCEQATREWANASTLTVASLWQALADAPDTPAAFVWRAAVAPSRVAAVLAAAGDGATQAHAGSGVVIGHADCSLADAQATLARLFAAIPPGCGNVVVRRCPPDWPLVRWGRPAADRALVARVCRHLDPTRRFNPGRFLPDLESA